MMSKFFWPLWPSG